MISSHPLVIISFRCSPIIKTFLACPMSPPAPVDEPVSREGLTLAKVLRFLSLPFRPHLLETYMAVNRFIEVPVDQLKTDGVQGVLIDADGTLGSHHVREFPPEVVAHVDKLVDSGLKVAIYTNACEDRFHQFKNISIVKNVPPKPDRRGFEMAMKNFLHLDDPNRVCMIGDNFLTDGGARLAGMRFIHIRPVKGNESFIHALTRELAFRCARFYFPQSFH